MTSPFTLQDEIALITGGGTGLGLGIARAMLAAGARVIIAGRRPEPLEQAIATLGGTNIIAARGDVTHPQDRATWLARARAELGGDVTIMVNNAGVQHKKPALEVTDDEFQALMAIHVNAAFALSREVAGPMLAAGHGSILFIASMASYLGVPQVPAYSAAKCAVIGLTRSLAAEWSPRGVRVNAIAPGWIDTPMTAKAFEMDPLRKNKVLSRTPMARMGVSDEIGRTAVYLCSPAASFVTGQDLRVDGGASIGF
jgi:gluconate 5-dehydrogenase